MKVGLRALAVLPVVAAIGVGTPLAANASVPVGDTVGTCKLVVPRAVRVSQPFYQVPVSVTGGCALHPGPDASWYPNAGIYPGDVINFNDSKRSDWGVYGDATKLGFRSWYGGGASNVPYTYLYSQDEVPVTLVKVGSWAGVRTARSGNMVTVSARAVRYATSLYRTIPWAGQTGFVQYKPVGGNSWSNLTTVTTRSDGNAKVSIANSTVEDYRVVFAGNQWIWDATSPTSRR